MTENPCKYVEAHQLMNLLHKNIYCQCHIDKGVQTINKLVEESTAKDKEIERLKNSVPGSVKSYIAQVEHLNQELTNAQKEIERLIKSMGVWEVMKDKDSKISRLESALLKIISMCDQYPDNWDISKVADEALTQESAPPKQKEE